MKRLLFVFVILAILFSSAQCFAQPSVSGTWSGRWKSIPYSPQNAPITCTLTQSGIFVSGTVSIWSLAYSSYIAVPVSGSIKANGFLNLYGSTTIGGTWAAGYLKGWVVGNVIVGGYGESENGQWADFGSCRLIKR